LIQLQNIQVKLIFSVVSLLLLAIVTGGPQFLQKALAQSDTHIVAAGDWGCSSNTEKTVQNAKSKNPQLLLALGDYSYEKTSTCWLNVMKPVNSITKINFGNHDEDSESLLNSYLSHFGLSKQYYSFDIHNVHVLTMATEEKFGTESEQYNFVVNDLRKAANNPDIKWIIVSMHYPFYSSPNTCKESDCAGNEESRELYHPLFDKYGVDLVLQGHVHNYQRSFPLNFNQESSSKPLVTSTNKAEYKNPNGAIFAIVGTGGVNFHGLSGSSPFMANQEDSKFGILDMHFSDNKLDANFVTNEGSTLDHFSISKTVKKKIIERISDNVVDHDKAIPVSDKEDKPAVSKELNDDVFADGKPKPLSDVVDNTVNVDESKPLSDKEDKPAVSNELGDDIVTVDKLKSQLHKEDGKPNPLSDKVIVTDDKAKPLSDQDKPAVSKELSDDIVTDDKPKALSDEDKPAKSDEDKSTSYQSSETEDKSNIGGLHGPLDNNDNDVNHDEVTNPDTEGTINTNERDPFAALN